MELVSMEDLGDGEGLLIKFFFKDSTMLVFLDLDGLGISGGEESLSWISKSIYLFHAECKCVGCG